ncbi:MAG: transcription elongation factor GreB [Bdellovibrionales bacterium RBG_16_40_8]|nr:MAG: transcription elongation factor GreB [Bdellovibrionales bacterium RBG_16_40_8]
MSDDNKKNYITPSGLEKLKAELKDLIHVERPQLVKTVAWAASNGDRSENADYIYGKRRLREIDRRSAFLTNKIEEALVVDPKTVRSDKVVFGATITVSDENGETKIFQIVGDDEIDAAKGRVSWKSPVARALLGKKVGDEVNIHRPKGEWSVEILSVEFK